jgi:peptidoglycan hydrolase-like protein with peptidoglycan-binding domain
MALGAAGVVALAAAGAGLAAADGGPDEPAADAGATATARIERRNLVEVATTSGTLGYADARDVANRLPGTITWQPDAGTIVHPGERLLAVDDEPVILLDGTLPAFRDLNGNYEGRDVRQLERNLRALGYDPDHDMTVNQEWTSATTDAVQRLQEDVGLPETGVLEFGRVVFEPGVRRVGAAHGAGFETTSRRREVTVDVDTNDAALVEIGARVSVELPTGDRRRGRISDVGATATATDPDAPDAGATIPVTITLRGGAVGFDQAPVIVEFEQERATHVLAIPVTALLARPGGAFAVAVVDGDRHRIVEVEPGLYTTGYVEISGDVHAGDVVTDAAVE